MERARLDPSFRRPGLVPVTAWDADLAFVESLDDTRDFSALYQLHVLFDYAGSPHVVWSGDCAGAPGAITFCNQVSSARGFIADLAATPRRGRARHRARTARAVSTTTPVRRTNASRVTAPMRASTIQALAPRACPPDRRVPTTIPAPPTVCDAASYCQSHDMGGTCMPKLPAGSTCNGPTMCLSNDRDDTNVCSSQASDEKTALLGFRLRL